MTIAIRAFANTDDAYVVWRPEGRIDGCLGFALYRRRDGAEEVVSTWVGWEDESAPPGTHEPSTDWPIQKYMWTDYLVRGGDVVQYRVAPVIGTKQEHAPDLAQASPWTPEVNVAADPRSAVAAYFNRGVVAAQWLARRLGPTAGQGAKLSSIIKTPGDKTRNFLGGAVRQKLLELLDEAIRQERHVYAALFELNDPELLDRLTQLRRKAHVVLANGSVKKKGDDANAAAREALAGVVDLHDRMCSPRALGHNKFMVLCNDQGGPSAVWTGSTNWSVTGLCTQANNALLVKNPRLAEAYLAYWKALKQAGDLTPESLRSANATAHAFKGGDLTVWFTPTPAQEDLDACFELIRGAKQGILFLMFNPGPRGSMLNAIIERLSPGSADYDPGLYIQGVINQDPGTAKSPLEFFHRGERQSVPDDRILLPEAIDEQLNYWVKELKKLPKAFAMVHSKVVVIDPFGERPVVITGSHNLGPKASGVNDENLVVVRGDAGLAQAYTANIMAIYNQYRWRYMRLRSETSAEWKGLKTNDRWQDPYFKVPALVREFDFWHPAGAGR